MDKHNQVPFPTQHHSSKAEQILSSRLKKTAKALEWELTVNKIIAELSERLFSLSSNITEMADLVLDSAKEITCSEYGYVAAVESKKNKYTGYILTQITDQCKMRTKNRRSLYSRGPDGGYSGLLKHLIGDLEPFFNNYFQKQAKAEKLPAGHLPLKKILSVPVILKNKVMGQIALANPTGEYTDKDIQVVKRLAIIYSLALDRHISNEKKMLMESQLRRSHKMEAIGTLAGGIAHDFNNILSPIIGYAELTLYYDSKNNAIKKNMKEILKAAYRAKALVSQILTFTIKREQKRKPVQISSIIKEVLNFLKASLPSTIEIENDVRDKTSIVEVDPTQMYQVIMNLCVNAKHAMQNKGGTLRISHSIVEITPEEMNAGAELDPGSYILLSVSDTGHGIAPEVMEKIFDPYFTTKKIGEGSGMGLSIVHGIIKNHGGDITVLSKPGQGTTFNIYLPRVTGIPNVQKYGSLEKIPKGNEHILVIDDEEQMVAMMNVLFQSLGYQVSGYTSSIDALQMFTKHSEDIDLVVTDMTMPKMTGLELAENLLSIKSDIPIILCTGYSEALDKKTGEAAGIKEYISKPIDMKSIALAIRKVLDHGI